MEAVVVVQESCLNQDEVEQAINEISHRLHEVVRPALIQILNEREIAHEQPIVTLLGVVAFAGSEVAIGVQSMIHHGVDKDKLVELCTRNFRQWMLDCIEQNTAELLN